MAMTPEGRVKADVKKWLAKHMPGSWTYMPMSNGMGRVGCPDFLVCYQGRFYAIETKAPGKRANTTPNQDREIAALRTAGAKVVVIDDVSQLQELFQ